MRIIQSFLSMLFFVFPATVIANTYSGSTPADPVIRAFLGISLKDSIDFIRWQVNLNDTHYTIDCNYGLSKPNTNGFIDGGKRIKLSGTANKKEYYYLLQNGNTLLKIASINNSLIHILDANNKLLVGNGGWSYTLTNIKPASDGTINFKYPLLTFKDSLAFEGRTPCGVPGIIPEGKLCYKLKWYIVLYTDDITNESGAYKVYGTPWRKQGGRTGKWKTITTKDGHTIYRLNNSDGTALIYLLQLDKNICVFIDAAGKLLTGNEDFSYTLNRVF